MFRVTQTQQSGRAHVLGVFLRSLFSLQNPSKLEILKPNISFYERYSDNNDNA